jgi:iron complex transport system substrate-binding protein
LKKIWLLIGTLLVISCHSKTDKNVDKQLSQSYFKYARHLSLDDFGKFRILHITKAYPGAPAYDYVLTKKNVQLPDSLKNLTRINVPLHNIVVTSTTHLPALDVLGLQDKLIGFPNTNYISNKHFREKVKKGEITDIGNGRQLNMEELLKLQPDLLMQFSSGDAQNKDRCLQENGIPVLYNADWTEQNPLGRAEWLKVFGLLFQKEKQSDSIFNQIEKKYLSIKHKIDTTGPKPIVLQGGLFGDKWYVPGGQSYATQLIKDAGGQYLWEDDTHTGSMALNYENVLLKAPKADVWLNPGMLISKEALLKQMPVIKDFKFYQKDRIYTYNLTKGPSGGVIYFEESNIHPDKVLNDLYHIFFPQTDEHYRFNYYKKLP